jgi:hypothetical protein
MKGWKRPFVQVVGPTKVALLNWGLVLPGTRLKDGFELRQFSNGPLATWLDGGKDFERNCQGSEPSPVRQPDDHLLGVRLLDIRLPVPRRGPKHQARQKAALIADVVVNEFLVLHRVGVAVKQDWNLDVIPPHGVTFTEPCMRSLFKHLCLKAVREQVEKDFVRVKDALEALRSGDKPFQGHLQHWRNIHTGELTVAYDTRGWEPSVHRGYPVWQPTEEDLAQEKAWNAFQQKWAAYNSDVQVALRVAYAALKEKGLDLVPVTEEAKAEFYGDLWHTAFCYFTNRLHGDGKEFPSGKDWHKLLPKPRRPKKLAGFCGF